MRVNGGRVPIFEKEKDCKFGKMGQYTKDGGSTIKLMVEGD